MATVVKPKYADIIIESKDSDIVFPIFCTVKALIFLIIFVLVSLSIVPLQIYCGNNLLHAYEHHRLYIIEHNIVNPT